MDSVTRRKLTELAAAIEALLSAAPVERARAAKELIDQAKDTFSRVRQDSIAEALAAGRTYEELAGELDVSIAAVNAAVTARNARLVAGTPVVVNYKGGGTKRDPGATGRIIGALLKSGAIPGPRILELDEDANSKGE